MNKRNLFYLLTSLPILAAAYIYLDHPSAVSHRSDEAVSRSLVATPEEYSLFSERKKRLKGVKKMDRPDLFAEYHIGIRTRDGDRAPRYSANYRVTELLKARDVSSAKGLRKIAAAPLNWIERGPGNVGGRTRALVVDPDDPDHNTWYAGSVGGGVWKTTDAGASWELLTPHLPNLATSTMAMAASNPDVIYVGTGEGFGNIDQITGSGIWKTTDRGATWEQVVSPDVYPAFRNIMRIIVDPADENTLLVAVSPGYNYNETVPPPKSGIYRSTDGGKTWTPTYTSSTAVQHLIANPKNFNTQYATEHSIGVIKSLDGGQTWFESSEGIGVHSVRRLEIAISPVDTSWLALSVEIDENVSKVLLSTDAGASWITGADPDGDIDFLEGQGWYDNTIAGHPYKRNIFFVGGVNLWQVNVGTTITENSAQITKIDYENTQSFLSLINFRGGLGGGVLDAGTAAREQFVSVELRFGPGRSQKAHRFTVPSGSTSGVPASQYTYRDYVDVPFELWDIDNNRQLMVSFRDQVNDGVFELREYNTNTSREYIFMHNIPYSETPDANITRNGGQEYQTLYFMWPVLPSGGIWDADNLPVSTLRLNWGSLQTREINTLNITDAYRSNGGLPKGVHPDHHNIILIPKNQATGSFRLINANDGGVTYSDDGGETFIDRSIGYNTSQFYGVDKMPGADRYIGGTQDNGSWVSPVNPDAATSWNYAPSGDGFQALWNYGNPDLLLESYQFNGIYRSTDRGINWVRADRKNGLRDVGIGNAPFLTRLAGSKQDVDLVFANGVSGVWRSTDFGASWSLIEMPEGYVGRSSFSVLHISLADPQIVWAAYRLSPGDRRIYVSEDGGLSFRPVNGDVDFPMGRVSGFASHPNDPNTAYALFSFAGASKILRTTDLGDTWEDISGMFYGFSTRGFPDVPVYDLLVMPFDENILWVGTDIGLFESRDGGQNWQYADNGLPAASIWQMRIVDDEVVVATHGRGVWTVSLPELANYKPRQVALAPHLLNAGGGAAGNLSFRLNLRSAYDSTTVVANGVRYKLLEATPAVSDTTASINIPAAGVDTVTVRVYAHSGDRALPTESRELIVYPLLPAQHTYINDLDSNAEALILSGFERKYVFGFPSTALHSAHEYPENANLSVVLQTPIRIDREDAMMSYEDIAIVEPADPNAVFGEEGFRDYVVVEGSNDNGLTWQPLLEPYDARYDSEWLSAYKANAVGRSSMYRTHTLNLADTFQPGEEVIIRFRLYSDGQNTAWGWAIDNIVIQANATSVAQTEELPRQFELSQNYPNPFNPATAIRFALPKPAEVTLRIINPLGRTVRTLIAGEKRAAGYHEIIWDGRTASGDRAASGVYFYLITTDQGFTQTKKMLLLQ